MNYFKSSFIGNSNSLPLEYFLEKGIMNEVFFKKAKVLKLRIQYPLMEVYHAENQKFLR